ncbi:MAG: hypothetical protein JNK63_03040 [Chthonomonas sp.]|nr:hypothetical protein [Chthonomonas sp.]
MQTSEKAPLAEFRADKLPYDKALLVVAGSQLEVGMKEERKPGEVVFNLVSRHGVTFEHEAYKFDSDRFTLWRAGGELYNPVIPLLENPVSSGAKWSWKGTMILAADGTPSTGPGSSTPATADIVVSNDKLNLRAGPVDSKRVDVVLKVISGGPNPAERKLSFWFVRGQGMIKREFAASSTRVPDEGQ